MTAAHDHRVTSPVPRDPSRFDHVQNPDVARGPDESVHVRVLALLGIPLGELFDFDALADHCASDGVYEFLFTSKPLGIRGGLGSPPNALAIK